MKPTAKRMTNSEREKIVKEKLRGDSYTDISRRHNISRSTIQYWFRMYFPKQRFLKKI